MGVSFSGELAYEIHIPNASLYAAYLALKQAGDAHGMKLFGARAVESMRMEKGYLHWKSDLLTEFDPYESGLDRFVKLEKDFVGKRALVERQSFQEKKKLVTLHVQTDRAAAHGGASVHDGDAVVGTVTSGEWGHRTGMNLAYAFVDEAMSGVGTSMTIDITGELTPATVIPPCPYDPAGERYRR